MDVVRTAIATITPQLNYTYDNLYRLDTATRPLTGNPIEDFEYDDVGNRTNRDGQGVDSTIGAGNRLLDDTVFTYTYDDNGNLSTKTEILTSDVTTYHWDFENQLTQIDLPNSDVLNYKYDGLGRRIEKSLNSVPTVRYVYDNEDILFEFDGSNVLQARYTHGIGIDEPLIMERDADLSGTFEATERFFYHTDGLGSITDLTDNLGAVVQSYVYDSFGNIVLQQGSLTNPFTYTGREFDSESGLYFYRARYYDPVNGRFLSEDPLGFIDTINLYLYVRNNAINWVDPFGLIGEELNPYTVPGQLPGKLLVVAGGVLIVASIPVIGTAPGVVVAVVGVGLVVTGGAMELYDAYRLPNRVSNTKQQIETKLKDVQDRNDELNQLSAELDAQVGEPEFCPLPQ